jgi:Flp pilus assembly secretin CpaC
MFTHITLAAFLAALLSSAASAAEPPIVKRSVTETTVETSVEVVETGTVITMAPKSVRVLRLDADPATIAIGDPTIVDAARVDNGTLILTAKDQGTTNLIILGRDNTEIAEITVHVGPRPRTIQVFSGTSAQTYSCSPSCAPSRGNSTPGDYASQTVTRDAQGNVVSQTTISPPTRDPAATRQAPEPTAPPQ